MKLCPFCASEVEKDEDTNLYHHNNSKECCRIKSIMFTKHEWETQTDTILNNMFNILKEIQGDIRFKLQWKK